MKTSTVLFGMLISAVVVLGSFPADTAWAQGYYQHYEYGRPGGHYGHRDHHRRCWIIKEYVNRRGERVTVKKCVDRRGNQQIIKTVR
ncbi:MAG: hypothetical protein V2B18_23250 [Pseudomonadota bacterium]